jgi:O-antigen biosynthesis protein
MIAFSVTPRDTPEPGHSYVGDFPPGLRGRWVAMWTHTPRDALTMSSISEPCETFQRHSWKNLESIRLPGISLWIAHVPDQASDIEFLLYGTGDVPTSLQVKAIALNQTLAALLLMLSRPGRVISALPGKSSELPARIRQALVDIAIKPRSEQTYGNWVLCYDTWSNGRVDALESSLNHDRIPRFLAVVFHDANTTPAALEATLASVRSSRLATEVLTFDSCRASLSQMLTGRSEDYVAILQAGEIVPVHGFMLAAQFIGESERPGIVLSDEDRVDENGQRGSPLFKPVPDHMLMVSGMLSRGLWLIRRDVFTEYPPSATAWAETMRLELWLRLYEAGLADNSYRIPYVLTHRRADTRDAPPAAIVDVVKEHLARHGLTAKIGSRSFPIDVQLLPSTSPKICIIVPSTCRNPHVTRCLPGILRDTSWPDFELIVVVSQIDDLDARQLENIQLISGDPRVRTLHYRVSEFNYSAANNYAASFTACEYLCFVNDDVLPVTNDWLEILMGNLSNPNVAVVGAKLLYEDLTVQHAGVMMGLGGMCEHIFRGLPQTQPGYAHRAVLDQELSAVTGACLLVRREVYDAVGGMDEIFPSGYNDIDFCMKVRARGFSVVWSAHAELYHFELSSFGHHYAGVRAPRQMIDVTLMWNRWGEICADDPYHNPNLSLVPGREWTPAFPPRLPLQPNNRSKPATR